MAAVWLYLSQAVPRYTGQTTMVLEFRKGSALNLEELFTGGAMNPSVIGTEIDIIRSVALLERVEEHLGLERTAEFNPALRPVEPPSLLTDLRDWARQVAAQAAGYLTAGGVETQAPEAEQDPETAARRLKRAIVDRLAANLEVENRRSTHTIAISYTSPDPRMAARVAGTVAEMYINDQLEAKFEASRRANEWLTQRLEGLRQEVQTAEQAVKNVRQQSGMIQARGGTLLEQQVGDVNAQLIQARLKKSAAEARLGQARQIMESPGGLETLGEVLDSDHIRRLRGDESALRRKKAEQSQRYGPRHPQMIQMDAEMADLQGKIREETNRIIKSIENEVRVARAEEQSLVGSLNRLRSEAGQAMQAELQMRELERQAESARTLYESYLARFQEIREQDDLQRPNARIISAAKVPEAPSFPKTGRTLLLAVAVGLMLGVMGAFLLETLDRGFRTGDQIEHESGLPILGSFPLLGRRQGTPLAYVVEKPYSSMAEALRAFLTALQLSNVDRPPKTVMVTSSLPREGKSMFSLAAGRMAAMAGSRVLVIDADIRRPVHHKRFADLKSEVRLEDVLQGQASVAEAIVQDPRSGLFLLMAHGNASAVRDMLGSRRMCQVLEGLKADYDLIILDTPPFMGVSDAWGLARNVDAVVFLVRWAETPRETVKAALRQMQQLDIAVSGIVMSMVNVRQQARYGYGGYGYYYGKYQKYYKD
jgi:capsular exopolysaccharide synthesis family protein